MQRSYTVLFLAVITAGCIGRSKTQDTTCYSDIDCPKGSTCDPWRQVCVAPVTAKTADARGAGVDRDARSKGGDRRCREPKGICDDGNPCTRNDVCTEDLACAGTEYSCDDGFDCTIDACDGLGGCEYVVAAGQCLIAGSCHKMGTASPLNPCKECLPSVKLHGWSVDDTNKCDDGNSCTTDDRCVAGKCTGKTPPECDDKVDCTVDACDPQSGCTFTPDPVLCDDGVDCTSDSCDAEAGCASAANNTLCDDGFFCTTESCDAEKGCLIDTDDSECDDGDSCTTDSCDAAKGCVNSAIEDCEP